MSEYITHAFPPIYDTQSRILILGTMPSPKSRENGFYYGHPRNRFWKVLSEILSQPLPGTNEAKICFLRENHIALWDVLASCEIHRADDSSIRNPVPNDLTPILAAAPIRTIFTTGTKAAALYKRYCYPKTLLPATQLPSTSPANCALSYEQLRSAYAVVEEALRLSAWNPYFPRG